MANIDKEEVSAIIQARYNSNRFPGKVLKKIGNRNILEIIIERLKKSKKISKIIVATSFNPKDKEIVNFCIKNDINYFIGPEDDVLKRYYLAAKKFKIQNIVRITADCPLVDFKLVDKLINYYFYKKVDYASNVHPPTYPDGLDVEVFNFKSLSIADKFAKSRIEREHVTTFISNNSNLKKYNLLNKKLNIANLRLTLDYPEDLLVLRKIFKNFNYNLNFTLKDILMLNKKIFTNIKFKRNEGYEMNTGQKFWKRAQKVIPGGTMLFSKNPDLFLPNFWPAYFKKTKGCCIWDLDGKKFYDLSMMGVGTNILGYSNSEVDSAVKKVISSGNMSSLNSKDEILLAENLIEIHGWSKMVRFARTGGEANAIAIRIARAATGRDKIVVCGYHGWHDWYLSANLSNGNNLNKHLMENISIKGVPSNLNKTVFSFDYNNYKKLERIISLNKNIAAVCMEVSRNEPPKNNFLQMIRKLTKKNNIALIFDECTSGFRENYGGLHLKYGVNPDIATFGKAIGNGYAITAVVGTEEIMKYAKSTFISSTFWTERIGPAAALKTLELMKKYRSFEVILKLGKYVKNQFAKVSKNNNISTKISGLNGIPNYDFIHKDHLLFKTFVTQEMLKKNFMASNSIYLCLQHEEYLKRYFEYLDKIFRTIEKCISGEKNINKLLLGPVCITGMRYKKN